jgi:LPS sulfotransferase NodH
MVAPLRRAVESSAAAYAASLLPSEPRSRFVIVCLPRTGSELLVDVLDQLPGVSCRGEILQQPVRRPIRVLTGRARLGSLRGARVWGCKLLVQHLQWYQGGYGPAADVLGELTRQGWTVLHLRRSDVLAGALSALLAEQTQRWHRRAGEDADFEPVEADVATMLAWVHTYDTYQSWLDEALSDVPHLDVTYEEDLQDPAALQRTVDRLAVALGAEPAPVQTALRPTAPADPFSRLQDPEAFKRVLRLTRFAHLVDD